LTGEGDTEVIFLSTSHRRRFGRDRNQTVIITSAANAIMGIVMADDRQYELHVLFGSPSFLPWNWTVWQQIAVELDHVFASVFGQPTIYSRQGQRVGRRLRDDSFGRMTWSEKNTRTMDTQFAKNVWQIQ